MLIVLIVLCALLLPFGWAAKPRPTAPSALPPAGAGQASAARLPAR